MERPREEIPEPIFQINRVGEKIKTYLEAPAEGRLIREEFTMTVEAIDRLSNRVDLSDGPRHYPGLRLNRVESGLHEAFHFEGLIEEVTKTPVLAGK